MKCIQKLENMSLTSISLSFFFSLKVFSPVAPAESNPDQFDRFSEHFTNYQNQGLQELHTELIITNSVSDWGWRMEIDNIRTLS